MMIVYYHTRLKCFPQDIIHRVLFGNKVALHDLGQKENSQFPIFVSENLIFNFEFLVKPQKTME